ncbi:hypothetical protein [Sulfurimonas sp.]|uniref:hypothetical protein n=1 Tax=Sulfurimonas sp. TaxID=2022749 RepID=UPI002AB163F8|nr:hypothetical protein [Sulfurimonas sp.]
MYKYSLILVFLFSGCSHFTINASMCDKIASEPNTVVPEECRNYNEKEADKAFNQTKHKQESKDEALKFNKTKN